MRFSDVVFRELELGAVFKCPQTRLNFSSDDNEIGISGIVMLFNVIGWKATSMYVHLSQSLSFPRFSMRFLASKRPDHDFFPVAEYPNRTPNRRYFDGQTVVFLR